MSRAFIPSYDIGKKIYDRAEPPNGSSAQRLAEISLKKQNVIAPNGEQLTNYHKRLLPPGFEASHFTLGTTPGMLELGGSKIAALICYDAEFPEYVCQAALAGDDVVIVPTALKAQRECVSDSILSTRALVNGLYVLYAIHAGAEGNS